LTYHTNVWRYNPNSSVSIIRNVYRVSANGSSCHGD
jgi:hypothetical protein